MNTQSALQPCIALEGIHGVHLVPHSPFTLEEIKNGELPQTTRERPTAETSQRLIMQ